MLEFAPPLGFNGCSVPILRHAQGSFIDEAQRTNLSVEARASVGPPADSELLNFGIAFGSQLCRFLGDQLSIDIDRNFVRSGIVTKNDRSPGVGFRCFELGGHHLRYAVVISDPSLESALFECNAERPMSGFSGILLKQGLSVGLFAHRVEIQGGPSNFATHRRLIG